MQNSLCYNGFLQQTASCRYEIGLSVPNQTWGLPRQLHFRILSCPSVIIILYTENLTIWVFEKTELNPLCTFYVHTKHNKNPDCQLTLAADDKSYTVVTQFYSLIVLWLQQNLQNFLINVYITFNLTVTLSIYKFKSTLWYVCSLKYLIWEFVLNI